MQTWKARRSGGRITITSKNADGSETKIFNVDTLEPGERGFIVATDKHGQTHQLPIAA